MLQNDFDKMKKERNEQLLNLQNCQRSLRKLKALKQLLQKLHVVETEWIEGQDAILAFSYEYLTAKLPKAEPFCQFPELFQEKIVESKIQKLTGIIYTKLRENQHQSLQGLAQEFRTLIKKGPCGHQIQEKIKRKQDNGFQQIMLEKHMSSQANMNDNEGQIRVDNSIQFGSRLSNFDSRYRLGSLRESASLN